MAVQYKEPGGVPSQLALTASLSGSLTAFLSSVYVVLCTIALIYRTKCDVGNQETISGSEYFVNVLYRLYIQQDDCEYSVTWEGLTQARTVYVMTCLTLTASLLCLIASIILITIVKAALTSRYLPLIVYMYAGLYTASFIVDVFFATLFGMDYTFISDDLDASSGGLPFNYLKDVSRLGAFLLMTVALKGFVAHAINILLICMMMYSLMQYTTTRLQAQHSIHRLGVLNGYDNNNNKFRPEIRVDDSLPVQSDSFNNQILGGTYTINTMKTLYEETDPAPDFMARPYVRSESWQPEQGALAARPFTYFPEPQRAATVKPRAQAQAKVQTQAQVTDKPAQWRMPIPAPDYSPPNQRRNPLSMHRTVFL